MDVAAYARVSTVNGQDPEGPVAGWIQPKLGVYELKVRPGGR